MFRKNKNHRTTLVFQHLKTIVMLLLVQAMSKISYMLELVEKTGNKRPIPIITRSLNQYPNYKASLDIKPMEKIKGSGSVVNFDDMLGAQTVLKETTSTVEVKMKI